MPDRVFILTNTLKTGGAEKQCIYLFKVLREKYNTTLVVYYGDQRDQRMLRLVPDNSESDILYLGGSHARKLRVLFKLFKKSSSPVCISYLATTNAINAIIGRFAGVGIRIGGIRNSEFHRLKKILQRHLHNHWLTHSVFNNYQGLETLSDYGFNRGKASVIHNAIELSEITEKNSDILTIISVGRFVEAKDYHTSLKAIKLISEKVSPFKYLIIGQGILGSEIGAIVSRFGLKSFVEVIVNPADVNQYYSRSDIYLSTSTFEGLSNSIMEAMSFGLPVVATDVGDNKFLVKEGETGFLTPVKDVDAIASKLELLLKDKQMRDSMGNKGREHIIVNFSIEKFTDQYIKLIDSFEKK